MYVSIRDEMIRATGFATLVEGLQYYGIEGVELAVGRDYLTRSLTGGAAWDISRDEDVEALGRAAQENGILIAAFLLPSNFNAPNIDNELAWHNRVTDAAGMLGIPAVRIDAIMHGERDLPLEERQDIAARGIRQLIEMTDESNVDYGIENHGFQGNDPAFLRGLLDKVGSPRLGLTLDSGNFYWSGKPRARVYEIWREFAPHAKHTHIKNIRYPEDMRETEREMGYKYGEYVSPIAEGDLDHRLFVAALRDAGYDRDLCLEDESLGKYDEPTRRANLKAAADFFQALI